MNVCIFITASVTKQGNGFISLKKNRNISLFRATMALHFFLSEEGQRFLKVIHLFNVVQAENLKALTQPPVPEDFLFKSHTMAHNVKTHSGGL